MPTINIVGGPLKSVLIQRAYGLCGQSVTDFELTPEEYDLGLQAAESIAATFPATFPYNYAITGDGNQEDESGLDPDDVLAFTAMLAQEIAPNIGKQVVPNKRQTQAISMLISKYTVVPSRGLGRQTIIGAGNRRWGWQMPFFTAGVTAVDEVVD